MCETVLGLYGGCLGKRMASRILGEFYYGQRALASARSSAPRQWFHSVFTFCYGIIQTVPDLNLHYS